MEHGKCPVDKGMSCDGDSSCTLMMRTTAMRTRAVASSNYGIFKMSFIKPSVTWDTQWDSGTAERLKTELFSYTYWPTIKIIMLIIIKINKLLLPGLSGTVPLPIQPSGKLV